MPSPFPGMDPFLEHPKYFPGLHTSLLFVTHEVLQRALPEPYFAVLNERLWVDTSQRYIEPDVDVLSSKAPARHGNHGNGGVMTLPTRSQPVLIDVLDDERREAFVEIRTKDPDDNERVVTTVEVLSLTNKTRGEHGRELYQRKQREILDGESHLVEIDLLRGGEHSTAVPLSLIARKIAAFDYHVSIHSFDRRGHFHVYPFELEECLPEIAVPLLPGDGWIPVDLQVVFDRCYDAGPFRRRVKYDLRRLVPPLSAKQARWVKQQLQKAKRS